MRNLTWILALSMLPLSAVAAESFPIIDAHTHTRFNGSHNKDSNIHSTRENYVSDMRKNGVVGAVSHTGQKGEGYVDLKKENVIHCAGVSGAPEDAARVEEGLKSGQFGCIKIYLGYVKRWAAAEEYKPLYRLAEKYDVAVVFHTGDTYDIDGHIKYADPLTIDEVAVEFRKVRFVIAHIGNPWIQSAAEVAYKNPNVWLDGSALMVGNLSVKAKAAKVEELVVKPLKWTFTYVEDPSKLMFGTDWPLTDVASYVAAFKRAIPKEHWKAVFHDNAVKVFKFKQ